ncbi:MAG TPA: hypothetical protein VKD71_05680, partial [Gemmataceae bacterium]|nr:hypothetical protein [Gemmataceae bacterium]
MTGIVRPLLPCKVLVAAGALLLASFRTISQPNAAPCRATGAETLATELAHYQPGETALISGTGYGASCAVGVRVTAATGAADSAVVTTDPAGELSFSYTLPQSSSHGQYNVETFLGDDPRPQTLAIFTNGPYIESERPDYAPNNPVTIRGAGWMPGETVTLVFDELDGPDVGMTYTAAADSSGRFTNSEFMTDEHDLAVHFRVTATGEFSGDSAQAEFKDGLTFTTIATGSWNSSFVWSGSLSGTITFGGSKTVTGTGTHFLTELSSGDSIGYSTSLLIGTVSTIESDTSLTLSGNAFGSGTGVAGVVFRSPGAGDDAVITGFTITVSAAASCNSLTMATTGGVLTIVSGTSLT